MAIVAARPGDAITLTELAFASKRHWGYPEQWIESWAELLTVTPDFVLTHETYKAVVDDQIVGFYALGCNGLRLDLLHMWVLPNWIGRGVGGSMFGHAAQRMKALGVHELEIESDPNAEGFYLRMGARRVGSRTQRIEKQQRELPILVYEIG